MKLPTILALGMLGSLLCSTSVTAQTNLEASMTVDNQFTAYLSTDDGVQGTQIGTGTDWNVTYQFDAALTPGVTNYLHILATDLGGPEMFVGEFQLSNTNFEFANGAQTLLTDTAHWQVSNTGFGSGYATPSDLGPQGTAPWGTRPSIDSQARFIWHPGADSTVYFSTAIFPAGQERTRFTVNVAKYFTDGNPNPVDVHLSCNTGLPLDQDKPIEPYFETGDYVEFVVVDFDAGELDCEVTEEVPAGYSPTYVTGIYFGEGLPPPPGALAELPEGFEESEIIILAIDDEHCAVGDHVQVSGSEDVQGTTQQRGEMFCVIVNEPDPVRVDIIKTWVIEGSSGPNDVSTEYEIELQCDGQIAWASADGYIHNYGSPEDGSGWVRWEADTSSDRTFSATVRPDDYGNNECTVEESVFDSAVEVDNGCGEFDIDVGHDESCTITNTIFFEGIPTLNQPGLLILSLLMLGVGLAGLRRHA